MGRERRRHVEGQRGRPVPGRSGEVDGQRWTILLDENWQETAGEPAYTPTARLVQTGRPLLGKAQIDVVQKNGERLFSLEVCWQEAKT